MGQRCGSEGRSGPSRHGKSFQQPERALGFGHLTDFTNPGAPIELAFSPMPDPVADVVVAGPYAYRAVGGAGVRVMDISNALAPAEVGAPDAAGDALGLGLSGNRLCVADGDAGLLILDVSDPANPVELVSFAGGFPAYGVAADGQLAYVADRDDGLVISDVSDLGSQVYNTLPVSDPIAPAHWCAGHARRRPPGCAAGRSGFYSGFLRRGVADRRGFSD